MSCNQKTKAVEQLRVRIEEIYAIETTEVIDKRILLNNTSDSMVISSTAPTANDNRFSAFRESIKGKHLK